MKYYVDGQLIAVRTDRPDGEINLFSDELHMLALANGYVKADDLDAIKAHVDEQVLDCIEDAHLRVERLRDEDFGAVAALKGYIRLAPDEVVVKRATAETALSVVKSEHLRCLKISEKYRPYDTTIADFTAALNREVTP